MNTPYNVSEFILERESYSEDIIVRIGNNSYLHDRKSIVGWFHSVGVSSLMVDRILDAVWNFRAVKYSLNEQRLITL